MRTEFCWRLAMPLLLVLAPGGLVGCQTAPNPSAAPSEQPDVATAAQPVKPGESTGELTYDGQRRTYTIYTPRSYRPDRPMPMVLVFHGYGSQGKELARGTGFNQLAEKENFIVVYPDGIERRWNPLNKALTGVDDVGLVPALVNHLQQIRRIDDRRIYAAGVSNGGFLVQRLACERNSPIAAYASVVASFPTLLQGFCNPPQPVPMLMINGTADEKVPWQGGNLFYGSILSIPNTINLWRRHNSCPEQPQVKQLGDRVEVARYTNCRNQAEVELVKLNGVGHIWPRGGSGPTQLLNGSQQIWSFFQRHSKSTAG